MEEMGYLCYKSKPMSLFCPPLRGKLDSGDAAIKKGYYDSAFVEVGHLGVLEVNVLIQ